MLEKGNVWYVRHYEAYFDEVWVVYLLGNGPRVVRQGNTTLVSLATGKRILELLFAPFRLLKFAQEIKPTSYLTADIVFSWWSSVLIKLILKAKVVLMPVCIPENIYRTSKQTLSGLPRVVERTMTRLCFLSADRILTGHSFGNFVDWLSENKLAKDKLIIIEKLVDALPTMQFFRKLREKGPKSVRSDSKCISLLYVGRLHKEKMVDDLLKALKILLESECSKDFYLTIVGDGPERDYLLNLAETLKVNDKIRLIGYLKNEDLVDYYLKADVYVSPLTGTSLREAGLCGLPIVAYNTDWIRGILKHEENALLVPVRDVKCLAREIIRLSEDEIFRMRMSKNIKKLAWKMWGDVGIEYDLSKIFG